MYFWLDSQKFSFIYISLFSIVLTINTNILFPKAPEGENQPSTEVDLFISTEKIMVLNTDLKEIMMDHGLRTISYIADIGELVVIMARRRVLPQVGKYVVQNIIMIKTVVAVESY